MKTTYAIEAKKNNQWEVIGQACTRPSAISFLKEYEKKYLCRIIKYTLNCVPVVILPDATIKQKHTYVCPEGIVLKRHDDGLWYEELVITKREE